MSKKPFAMSLTKCGLMDEFVALCRTGVNNAALHAWCAAHPQVAEIAHIPLTFRSVRKTLGCEAPHGGKRGNQSREAFYKVQTRTRKEAA